MNYVVMVALVVSRVPGVTPTRDGTGEMKRFQKIDSLLARGINTLNTSFLDLDNKTHNTVVLQV